MKERKISGNEIEELKPQRITIEEVMGLLNEKLRADFGTEVEIAGQKYDLPLALDKTDTDRYDNLLEDFIQEKVSRGEWFVLDDNRYSRSELERVFGLKPDEIAVESDPFY